MAAMDRRRAAITLGPPILMWAASSAAVLGACLWAGASPWDAEPWVHGDGGLYLAIAKHGYVLYRCGAVTDWCGDTGWLPLLPWLAAAVHYLTGLSVVAAGVGVAFLFHAATLVLLWTTFLERRLDFRSLGALAFAAFAPGLVFHETFFPLSLLSFFTVLNLWLLYRGRRVGAGLAGAGAALAYPQGVLLAVTAAVWLLLTQAGPLLSRLRAIAIVSGLTVAGLGVFLVDQKLEVNAWNSYVLAQEKYQRHFQQPFAQLENALHILRQHSPFAVTKIIPVQTTNGISSVTADQTVVVALLLLCGLVAVFRRRPVDRLGLLLAIWAVVFWVVPQLETEVQSYRIEASMVPLALFLPRLPKSLVAVFCVLVVAMSVPLARLQFQGWLV